MAVFMPASNITQRSWICIWCQPTSGVRVTLYWSRFAYGVRLCFIRCFHRLSDIKTGRTPLGNLSHSLYTGCRNQKLWVSNTCVNVFVGCCSHFVRMVVCTCAFPFFMFRLFASLILNHVHIARAYVMVDPSDCSCTMSTLLRRMCWPTHLNTFETCPNCLGGFHSQVLSFFCQD